MIENHLEGANATNFGAPVGTFETADGFLNLNARRDAHFRSLCTLLDKDDLAEDPRFIDSDARTANAADVEAFVRPALKQRPTAEWLADFEAHDILAGRVNSFPDVLTDPHVEAREAVRWLEHAAMGPVPMPIIPGAPLFDLNDAHAHAPELGAHTREVLTSLGLSPDAIEDMITAGAAG
jgi:crotonobetainyl-CoA:carnitine CoA-transferase CaiB-like acyl-CoA transferase